MKQQASKQVTGKSYLVKSLSTSYSYFIQVSLYTINSITVKTAMVVKAIRETETVQKGERTGGGGGKNGIELVQLTKGEARGLY